MKNTGTQPITRLASIAATSAFLATVVLMPAPSPAQTVGGTQFRAWSDLLLPKGTEEAEYDVANQTSDAAASCPKKTGSADPMPVNEAVDKAEALVIKKVPGPAYKKLKKSREYRNVDRAQAAAFALAAKGGSLGSLALLLRAHDLEPRDPAHLIDASSLLINFGKYREALALLKKADGMKKNAGAPMGISRRAILVSNRGQAMLMLGRYPLAQTLLTRAVDMEPMLSEARTNLSAVELCQDRVPGVAPKPRKNAGVTRTPPPGRDLLESLGVSPGSVKPPQYPSPAGSPEAAVAAIDTYGSTWSTLEDAAYAAEDRASAAYDRMELSKWSGPIFGHLSHWAMSDDSYDDLSYPEWQREIELDEIFAEGPAEGESCSWGREWLPRFNAKYLAWLNAAQAFQERSLSRGAAAAGGISNPDAAEYFSQSAQADALHSQAHAYLVLGFAANWIDRDDDEYPWPSCFGDSSPLPYPGSEVDGGDAPGTGPCSDPPLKISILFAEFEVQCDNFGMQVQTPGWAGAFVKATTNLSRGSLTVFAGARAGVSAGPWSAEAKTGMTWTWDRNSDLVDQGWQLESSAGGQVGGVGTEVSLGKIDVSFVSSYAWPGPGSLN